MVKESKPRRGSLQFWPRVRARRIYPRIRNWPKIENTCFLGFAGYKVGMMHVIAIDNRKYSHTRGEKIFIPITVIESPPLDVIGIRAYKLTSYGLKSTADVYSNKLPKYIEKKIKPKPRNKNVSLEKLEKMEFDEIRAIVATRPYLTTIGKKKPEVFEIAVGGKDPNEKLEFLKKYLGKAISVSEVLKEGQLVDVFAVTKGKGFQGAVKRFGVKLLSHKTKGESGRRRPGTLGPWTPARLDYRRGILPGQMGFHTRCEYNKWIIKIGKNPEEINPKGGWPHYGVVRNDYILIKGSIPGPAKRLIRLRYAIRPDRRVPEVPPQIVTMYLPR